MEIANKEEAIEATRIHNGNSNFFFVAIDSHGHIYLNRENKKALEDECKKNKTKLYITKEPIAAAAEAPAKSSTPE